MAGRPIDYVGTDFDSVAVERCREIHGGPGLRFEVEDISHPSLDSTGFDVVFCINVLPYVPDPRPILATLARRCAAGTGLLVVMDPVPSAYWGAAFGGFRIRLRRPDEIAAAAESICGRSVDAAVLYTWQLLGRPVLPVGAMSAWRFPDPR
jgi:2-polyprenyl-3-methyl-5-hydroxy-6-metoxy-1,4-benzoquinol methylase